MGLITGSLKGVQGYDIPKDKIATYNKTWIDVILIVN